MWNCAAGRSGASVIAVHLGAFGADGNLKRIWRESGGCSVGEAKKELLEALASSAWFKGCDPSLISTLLESCVRVRARANSLLRVQGDCSNRL